MHDDKAVSAAARQDPLRASYLEAPAEAMITDRARTSGGTTDQPFHGTVSLGQPELAVQLPFGIHAAVGGFSDAPNPGDLLCGALAACLDATLRVIANRLGVVLTTLEVAVEADVDTRGTLLVDRKVPVGFLAMRCEVRVVAVEGTDDALLRQLVEASEHSCVNLQTLLAGVKIETRIMS